MTSFLLALIAFYRRRLSAPLHAFSTVHCKFVPTCSEYAEVAIATHGALRGSALAAWRLLRCHPFSLGGLDPVPPFRPDCSCGAAATHDVKASAHQQLP
jgi:hypothetical protein